MPLEVDGQRAVHVEYIAASHAVCVVCEEAIVLVPLATRACDQVGMVSDKILAASWSPDQELLMLVTGAHNLLCLSRDFDVVRETTALPADFGQAAPVT